MSDDCNEAVTSFCASCGVAENEEVKLKNCNGCYLVKYCGIQCQKAHRKQHKRACKIRAAELRDELLFKQPESSHLGDCPICSLPMPLDLTKSGVRSCCSKVICNGCTFAEAKQIMEMRLQHTCPFCRESTNRTDEEDERRRMKRIEANDPVALRREGDLQQKKGNCASAFGYFTKAAKLRDAQAHYRLAGMYHNGQGVEMEKGKYTYHLEEAAIGGHPHARYHLGKYEWEHGSHERAVKHWIIAATQGDDDATKALMISFRQGYVSKEQLDATLRVHKAAVDATKSPHREEVENYY